MQPQYQNGRRQWFHPDRHGGGVPPCQVRELELSSVTRRSSANLTAEGLKSRAGLA